MEEVPAGDRHPLCPGCRRGRSAWQAMRGRVTLRVPRQEGSRISAPSGLQHWPEPLHVCGSRRGFSLSELSFSLHMELRTPVLSLRSSQKVGEVQSTRACGGRSGNVTSLPCLALWASSFPHLHLSSLPLQGAGDSRQGLWSSIAKPDHFQPKGPGPQRKP